MALCDSGAARCNTLQISRWKRDPRCQCFSSNNKIRQFAREEFKVGTEYAQKYVQTMMDCVPPVGMTCSPLLVLKFFAEMSARWRRGMAGNYDEKVLKEKEL